MRQGYQRSAPGAQTAVLLIHGIVGTPDHFRDFVPLIPENVSVCNLLLDGHGGSVKEFSHTSMKQWNRQVDETVAALLQTHEKLVIVAHSMGTLFAIRQAVVHPDRIKGLFLLASPLCIHIRLRCIGNALRTCLGIEKTDPISQAAKNAYGIESDPHLWRYLGWIPRYLELLSEIRKTRALLLQLNVPCQVFQSGLDEVVSRASCRYLRENPTVDLTVLEQSSHYYYHPQDLELLLMQFTEILS